MSGTFRDLEWTHNPLRHTKDENLRWAWLRGCEWNSWPSFLSEPIIPILLVFWPLWQVLVGVLIANVCWASVRYRGVSVILGDIGVYFRLLKWPITLLMEMYFVWKGNYHDALICGLWLPLSGVVIGTMPPVGQIGRTQRMFMAAIGYTWDEQQRNYIDARRDKMVPVDLKLTDEEKEDVRSFFALMNGEGGSCYAKAEDADAISNAFIALALHLRADNLAMRLRLAASAAGSERNQAVDGMLSAAMKASVICPIPIYTYDLACALELAGKPHDAKLQFERFLRRQAEFVPDRINRIAWSDRDVPAAIAYAEAATGMIRTAA